MCDHCVKRERAYRALPFDQQAEVDAFTDEANARMAQATAQAVFGGGSPEELENSLLAFGDSLDLMLGLSTVPAYPPDFA